MARVLLVDDETGFREALGEMLVAAGHSAHGCGSAEQALETLRKEEFDVLLTDLRMPGCGGLPLLREAAIRLPECVRIVVTAYGSLESAIEALRAGAHDYLLKPVHLEAVVRKIDFLGRHQATVAENRFLRAALGNEASTSGLIGSSTAMEEVRSLIGKVAATGATVLITGETGTGKELVARAIHEAGARKDGPFLALNCGSVPETLLESEMFGHCRGAFTGAERDKRGLFEAAQKGTLFLDEIGEMPASLQPKILRAIEAREILRVGSTAPTPIDVRIVAATHRNLRTMMDQDRFRADLYYRLAVFEIALPPLRDRRSDIAALAEHLILRASRRLGRLPVTLDPAALRMLERYRWPGNVRELANVLERALILSDEPRVLPADLRGILLDPSEEFVENLRTARQDWERTHIRRVIQRHDGDKRAAAAALGIDLSSLYRKLEE